MPHEPEQIKNHQLARLIELAEANLRLLRVIVGELAPPKLTSIAIQFSEGNNLMATPGPVTLTSVGQAVTASVIGYDQLGNVFTGPIPTTTFTSSDTASAIVAFDPTTGLTTAVANGVANITASLTTAEGLALTDTEAVTVAIPVTPPPTPVLSSIKVAFA
jgi:uncharacterized protein YjdB